MNSQLSITNFSSAANGSLNMDILPMISFVARNNVTNEIEEVNLTHINYTRFINIEF